MEKHILLLSISFFLASAMMAQQAVVPVYLDDSKPMEERVEDALSRMTLQEKIAMIHAQSKFSTPGCPRLGIPELWMSDGPHGVRMEIEWDTWKHAGWTNDSCTAYPALTCLAATFNRQMAYEYGNALGEESRYRKKDLILGPGVNIYRTPFNGRNFEYMGEDPYLAAQMVVPYIQGVQRNGVAATLKHYALNNQETWRNHIDVQVSDRALYEIYLPAFKAGVQQGGVWAVMGAYNKYQGQYTTHHERLVNEILKGEWGFDGAFVTDWGSAHDTRQAALYGLDIEMGTKTDGLTSSVANAYDDYFLARPYLELIQSGELPESGLDDKVRRVLRLTFRTSMNRNRPWGSFSSPEHLETARRIAEEGIVLLKNDAFFPVAPGRYRKIAVIGENATRPLTTGGGSSELKVRKEVSPLEGIERLYGKEYVVHAMGYGSGPSSYGKVRPSPYDAEKLKAEAIETAKDADVVLFFGGLNKSHEQDCEAGDRVTYHLPFGQCELIEALLDVNPNMGIILLSGNAVATPWLDRVPGLMQGWFLGSETGHALAHVISGEVNPSGKLPFSFPMRIEDNGAHHFGALSYPGDSIRQVYMEDIYIGYRWHDTKNIPARFPFGYGLSYTTFDYGKIRTDKQEYGRDESIKVSFTLTNTGKVDGAEAVQIYVSQQNPALERPAKELKGFDKVFLKAGESRTVEIAIPVSDLAYYNDRVREWVVQSDRFTIHCGASSADIRSSVEIRIK